MKITQYTEKSFVVRMEIETEAFTQKMTELGGKYNEFLRGGNGWIFPNFKKQCIESYIENTLKSSSEDNFSTQPRIKPPSGKNEDCCSCNCVDRVNKFENTILLLHKSIDALEKKLEKLQPNTNINFDPTGRPLLAVDDYEEELNYVPHIRLLNTRK
jgi:hypothetical protein